MEQSIALPGAERRRRVSIVATSAIALAFLIVAVIFAANTQWYFVFKMLHVGAAVIWVGGGLFIAICAILAELANDDDQLLVIGRFAARGASTSFVVLGFGFCMTSNANIPFDQFWLIFGLVAWALSAATGIFFLTPETKRLT